MAKKKKNQPISEGQVAEVLEGVMGENSEKAMDAHDVKPERELPQGEIQNHSKFDKFKKGAK